MKKSEVLNHLDETSMITPEEGSFLYDQIVDLPEIGSMLDIGTGLGHSALMFSKAKPNWVIYTIDIYSKWKDERFWNDIEISNIKDIASLFDREEATNIIQIIGDSNKLPLNIPLNAVFIDGNHDYEHARADFERFSPFIVKNGVIMFHDANMDDIKKLIDEIGAKILESRPTVAVWRKK